jgi:hypothetical protein
MVCIYPREEMIRMTQVLRALALMLLALPLLFVPLAASAQVTPCGAQLDALRAAINAAPSLSDKTRVGLLDKVANAQVKLEQGKTADAVGKLTDLKKTVITQRDAGKITSEDGAAILNATDAAIACISSSAG